MIRHTIKKSKVFKKTLIILAKNNYWNESLSMI
jgi:hypothetical protein